MCINDVEQWNCLIENTINYLNSDEPLPVELVSFEAKSTGTSVSLSWTTGTETNNKGFFVERKTESEKSFNEIRKCKYLHIT